MAIPCENPQEKFVHPLRTLVAAEIDSRVYLMRIRVQHFPRGGAERPRSLNLKRVSPCHSSSTGQCTRFSNNRRRQPVLALHSDIGESVHKQPRRANDSRAYPSTQPHHCCTHNSPLPAHQLAQLARTLACNYRNTERKRTCTRHKHWSTAAAHDASQQETPVSQLLGRFSEIQHLNRV
jgi:hypothetical protein